MDVTEASTTPATNCEVAVMTNAIFLFMLGLTVGIILSMTLVSHYHKAGRHDSLSTESEILQLATAGGETESIQAVTSNTLSEKNDANKSSETLATKSSWIPGRVGEFIKNVNLSDTSSGTMKSDGKNIGDLNSRKSTRKRKKALNNNSDNLIVVNGQELDDQNNSSNSDIGNNVGLSDNKEKGQSDSIGYGIKDLQEEENKALMLAAVANESPNGTYTITPYKDGDNFQIQSKFFDENGARVSDINLLDGKSDAIGGLLYDHPPLIPYHSQSAQQHLLDPPYIPSLKSVIVQRAAQLLQETSLQSNISFASR